MDYATRLNQYSLQHRQAICLGGGNSLGYFRIGYCGAQSDRQGNSSAATEYSHFFVRVVRHDDNKEEK